MSRSLITQLWPNGKVQRRRQRQEERVAGCSRKSDRGLGGTTVNVIKGKVGTGKMLVLSVTIIRKYTWNVWLEVVLE